MYRTRSRTACVPWILVPLVLGMFAPAVTNAALVVGSVGSPHTIDFQSFLGDGFSPSPTGGQLDSNTWRAGGFDDGTLDYGGVASSGDFARGSDDDGGVRTGGIYSFRQTGTGNRMLGIQPTGGDFTPGFVELKVLNHTGQTVSSWGLSYDIFYRNDQPRGNALNLAYSADGATFIDLPALDFDSPASPDLLPSFMRVSRGTTIFEPVPHDGNLFLRWSGADISGSGARDEFGLDNITLTAAPEPGSLVLASISALGLIGVGLLRRQRQRKGQQPN